MKIFKMLTALGLACLLVMACTEKQPATIGQADQTDAGQNPTPVAMAKPGDSGDRPAPAAQVEKSETQGLSQEVASSSTETAEIDGTLMQTQKGLAVVTDTQAYVVTGRDLSDMIGQTVKVTGAVAEVDGGQVIEIMTVVPAE